MFITQYLSMQSWVQNRVAHAPSSPRMVDFCSKALVYGFEQVRHSGTPSEFMAWVKNK